MDENTDAKRIRTKRRAPFKGFSFTSKGDKVLSNDEKQLANKIFKVFAEKRERFTDSTFRTSGSKFKTAMIDAKIVIGRTQKSEMNDATLYKAYSDGKFLDLVKQELCRHLKPDTIPAYIGTLSDALTEYYKSC